MNDCTNWNIDCYKGVKKCDSCAEYCSKEDHEAYCKEFERLEKIYNKKRAKKAKKYWLLKFLEEYKDFTREQLLNECVKLRLKLKGYFIRPYIEFRETEEFKLLKAKYPTARWI